MLANFTYFSLKYIVTFYAVGIETTQEELGNTNDARSSVSIDVTIF